LLKFERSPSAAARWRHEFAMAGYLISLLVRETCCWSFSLQQEGQAGVSDARTKSSNSAEQASQT